MAVRTKKARIKLLRAVRKVGPSAYGRRMAARRIAKQLGLAYSGTVRRRSVARHAAIGGMSASTSHKDSHRLSGNIREYSVAFVERHDIITRAKHVAPHTWLVAEVKLKTKGLPHTCLYPSGTRLGLYEHFVRQRPSLHPLHLGMTAAYPAQFQQKYTVSSAHTHLQQLEKVLTPAVTEVIVDQLWPTALEMQDNYLYLYQSSDTLDYRTIKQLLKNGLWLAKQIDKNAE